MLNTSNPTNCKQVTLKFPTPTESGYFASFEGDNYSPTGELGSEGVGDGSEGEDNYSLGGKLGSFGVVDGKQR